MLEIFDAILQPVMSMFESVESSINITAPAGVLLLGLLIGLRHSMEADHVAAVSTMVASGTKSIKKASILGAVWGLGHTASLLIAGFIVLLLAVNIPQELSSKFEFGVGIMLVILAAATITGRSIMQVIKGIIKKERSHKHAHEHGNFVHAHEHAHHGKHYHTHKSLIVGMVHGLAGSGALMVLILPTISSISLGLAYIGIFGAGSIIGMAAISTVIGIPFTRIGNDARLKLVLRYVAGITTLIIGAGLIYDLVIIEEIFQ